MILENIQNSYDIKKLNNKELEILSKEIREFLVDKVSKNGGHLSSNLGIVELTLALHRVFDIYKDKIIWDVGHQSYVHKILTNRKDDFDYLRKLGHISGFTNVEENKADTFNTGHSSTSISIGLGFVYSRDYNKNNYSVVSVIGDGSLTGGLAFEALNNASSIKSNFIIVLNDNEMSIGENVGGIHKHLSSIRTDSNYLKIKNKIQEDLSKNSIGKHISKKISKVKNSLKYLFIEPMIFEDMGIKYLGPINGHNESDVEEILKEAKKINGPVIVHIKTIKGKGYKLAEENPSKFHGISSFNKVTGEINNISTTYTNVFSDIIIEEAKKNKKIIALSAAMRDGCGLKKFSETFPDRFIDVGIAEGHLVTFASSLAANDLIPVLCCYSSFLQRGFDQIIHDVSLTNKHVIFMIDRAGIVGNDGATHHGLFDISYLTMIPNMCVLSPKDHIEFKEMFKFAINYKGPIAIRYPKEKICDALITNDENIFLGKSEIISKGSDICFISFGPLINNVVKIKSDLEKLNISCSLINLRFAKPLDKEMIKNICMNHKLVVTFEEGVISGGVGEHINRIIYNLNHHINVLNIGIDDIFVTHGDISDVKKYIGFDNESIKKTILEKYMSINE